MFLLVVGGRKRNSRRRHQAYSRCGLQQHISWAGVRVACGVWVWVACGAAAGAVHDTKMSWRCRGLLFGTKACVFVSVGSILGSLFSQGV